LPALLCYIPLGIIYGVLCTQAGKPWYYAPLFSFFVLAGAMQFLALTLTAMDASLFTIMLAMIPLGIRNFFYGFTMLERYRKVNPLLRLYLAHGLVDATYSLLHGKSNFQEQKKDVHFITWLTLLIHFYWVLGSLLGSFVLHLCTMPQGLEFSLTAFFAAISVDQFLKSKSIQTLIIAAFSITAARLLLPNHFFLGGMIFSILAFLFFPLERVSKIQDKYIAE
jgi:4-azaleucine resistance transporter AzlC